MVQVAHLKHFFKTKVLSLAFPVFQKISGSLIREPRLKGRGVAPGRSGGLQIQKMGAHVNEFSCGCAGLFAQSLRTLGSGTISARRVI